MTTEAAVRVNLLGPPVLEAANGRHAPQSRKAAALLAYLALRAGDPMTRDHLSSLLWPDSQEEQARTNLRQALTQLRRGFAALGVEALLVEGDRVALDPALLDVPARDLLAGRVSDPAALAQSPGLLEGFAPRAAPFENWAAARAREFDLKLVEALARHAEDHASDGELAAASSAIAAALARDPLNEALHHRQMQLLAAMNRSEAALAQFVTCRATLAEHLGVDPAPETLALAKNAGTRQGDSCGARSRARAAGKQGRPLRRRLRA